MKHSRTAFLVASTAGTAVLAAAAAPAQAAPGFPPIDGILRRPAKHKQVIAAPKLAGGAALRYAGNTLNAFQFSYSEGANACHTACVLYGTSIFYVLNDALWGRYALFDVLDRSDDALPNLIHTPRNPFLHARSTMNPADPVDKDRGFYRDFSVEALTKRGVTWFVCNNALHEITRALAGQRNVDPASVYDDFRKNVVPGVTLVPAGVAAIVLAQEAGFGLLPA